MNVRNMKGTKSSAPNGARNQDAIMHQGTGTAISGAFMSMIWGFGVTAAGFMGNMGAS